VFCIVLSSARCRRTVCDIVGVTWFKFSHLITILYTNSRRKRSIGHGQVTLWHIISYFASRMGAIEVLRIACLCVCLSVCPLVCLKNHMSKFHEKVLYMLPVTVAGSSSDNRAISYVLTDLWMMSCFHTLEPMGQNQRQHGFGEFARRWHLSRMKLLSTTAVLFWLGYSYRKSSIVTYFNKVGREMRGRHRPRAPRSVQ